MNEIDRLTFDSPLGPCSVAWDEQGIQRLQLGVTDAPTGADRRPGDVPAEVLAAVEKIQRHLGGDTQDLSSVPISLTRISPFHRRIYALARQVPPGRTTSYQELAAKAGSPRGARAVGQAMAKNPFLLLVPCHRVLAANKRPGGFSAPGGFETKRRLLALEGVAL